jgi:hypothetical protein
MPLEIEYDDGTYTFEELDLDLDDAEVIQKYVGRSLGDWANGLATAEVKSLVALWWLLRKQAGERVGAIASKPPGFKPLRLYAAYADAVQAEAARLAAEKEQKEAEEEAAQPDPTQAAPSSPAPAGTTTTPASGTAAILSPPG